MVDRAAQRAATLSNAVPAGGVPWNISALVSDYHAALYRFAYRLTGSVQDAEDLTQQVFLIAQQKLDQVRDAECVRGWLFAVLRNCFLKSRRHLQSVAGADFDIDINQIPDEVAGEQIDSAQLQVAINALSDDFKMVILMFYFEHRSYREVAELLDIPLGTVMSRLARAKANLRQALQEPPECNVKDAKQANGKAPQFPEAQFPEAHGPAVIRQ